MRRIDVHNELSCLGVSSEVHALVDDLDLDIGRPCITLRMIFHKALKEIYVKPRCRVYVSHYYNAPIQGRLF